MPEDFGLTPQAQLAVRKYVSNYLLGIAALIGITNIAAILGALYFLVGKSARQAVDQEIATLRIKEELSTTLMDLGGARQQISAAQEQIAALTTQAQPLIQQADTLKSNLESVMNADNSAIGDAARLIEIAQNNPDFMNNASKADVRIESSEKKALRAYVGRVCSTETPWQQCAKDCGNLAPKAGEIVVSMSEAGFTEAPAVFISQSGSGSWTTKGLHAIYNITQDSFKLFAYNDHLGNTSYAEYANRRDVNHCLTWLALGR